MSEAIAKANRPLRTRIREWWRRIFSSESNIHSNGHYSSPTISGSRPEIVEKDIRSPELSRKHQEILPGLYHRFNKPLEELYSRLEKTSHGLSIDLFRYRLLNGLDRIITDSYKFMHQIDKPEFAHLILPYLMIFYQYGTLCEQAIITIPYTEQAIGKLLADSISSRSRLDYLAQGENLRYFMRTLDFMLSQLSAEDFARIEKSGDQSFEQIISFLNLRARVIFEQKKIANIEIEAERNRQKERAAEKKRIEEFEEEQMDAKLQAIREMVEKGKAIDAARRVFETGSVEETIKAISNLEGEDQKIVTKVFAALPETAVGMLVETAVHLKLDNIEGLADREEAVKNAIHMAASILGLRPASIPGIIKALELLFQDKTRSVIPEEPRIRADIIKEILNNTFPALPYLIEGYSKHYSGMKRLISRAGIKTRDIATQVFEPLILGLAQRIEKKDDQQIEGKDILLRYIFEKLSEPASNNQPVQGLGEIKIPESAAIEVVKTILAEAEKEPFPAFAEKSLAQEMKETVAEIVNAPENQHTLAKLTPQKAESLLTLAAKIQIFTVLLRRGNGGSAGMQFSHLDHLDGTRATRSIRIPNFDLFTTYLHAELNGSYTFAESDAAINHQIIELTRGNVLSANRVIRELKRKDNEEIYTHLPQTTSFPRAIREIPIEIYSRFPVLLHFVKYAYCFLTAGKEGLEKSTRQDLKVALEQDTDRKQLFLALQYIPPAVLDQLFANFRKALAKTADRELAPEVEIFQKILEVSHAREQAELIKVAARMVLALQEYGNGKLWKNILRLAQNGSTGEMEFFLKRLIENLEGRERDYHSIQLAIKETRNGEEVKEIVPILCS